MEFHLAQSCFARALYNSYWLVAPKQETYDLILQRVLSNIERLHQTTN